MKPLTLGDAGPDVLALQRAVNDRARARRLPTVSEDGEYGPATDKAVERVARALGAREDTILAAGATVGEQRIIRWPTSRNPVQLARARQRAAAATKAQRALTLRDRAYREAVRLIGVMEQGGNNRGRQVEQIIREGGGVAGQAWCGWFMAAVYRRAGSKAIEWRWGAVRLMALVSGVKPTSSPQRGDIVRFTFDHTGMFVRDLGNGSIETIEGNTGQSGAVSDSRTGGDGVYRKIRSKRLVSDYLQVTR